MVAYKDLFDEAFYLASNADVRNAINAGTFKGTGFDHYNSVGYKEGRDPNALFDTSHYLLNNLDVLRSGTNPLSHYYQFGGFEGRDPSAHFDSSFYLQRNADVAHTLSNPLVHFLKYGGKEGRNPSAQFDNSKYITEHADVKAAGLNGLAHYLSYGSKEGRAAYDTSGNKLATNALPSPVDTVAVSTLKQLTVNKDIVTGTANADTINGGVFVSTAGTFINTLNNADEIDGGGGTDTLDAQLNGGVTIGMAVLNNVEVIQLESQGGGNVLNLANADGSITTVRSVNSGANAITFQNINSVPTTFGISNSSANYTVGITTARLAGATDAATLNLANVTGGTVSIAPMAAGSGYETLNVVSGGNIAQTIGQLTDGVGTSLATINVSGAQNLSITAALDDTVTKVDASAMTGALTMTTGTSVMTATGGSGNDTFIFGGTYVGGTGATADTVDGGGGSSDALSTTSAIATAIATAQTKVTNVEQLTISDALGAAINTTHFASVTRLNLSADPGNFNITIDSGDEVRFAVTTTAIPDLVVSGIATTDTALVTLASGIALAGDALTTTGVETLTINSLGITGTTNTINQLTMTNTAASEVVKLTGAAALTFTLTSTVDSIDGSAMTGALTLAAVTTAASGAGVTITSGSAADTLRGSTGADIISSGAGNDVVLSEAGVDIVDLGAGDDTLDFTDKAAADMLLSGERDNVTNFTANNTAYTAGSGIDRINFGNVLTGLDISAGGTTANFQTQAAPGAATLTNAQGFIEFNWEFSSAVNLNDGSAASLAGTTLLSALGGLTGTTAGTITVGTNDFDAILIAYQGGRAFLYGSTNADGNTGIAAAEIGLIGVFEGVAVGGFAPQNFI
ncbi:MAG: hypothetical protein FJX67_17045 [Alphaproteobacteria bacterium]|nr:hypothetical protein [Alphaproteobacteria bacterium]